jgi:hypothetical protein
MASMTLNISPQLQLPVDAVTETFGILAKKGAGKSNAAVVMAEEMHAAGIPWVAVDPKGDWWGLRAAGDGNGPGLPIVVFGGRHGDVPLEPTAGALIADLVLQQGLTCVLDVSEFSKADVRRFLLAFAERLYRQADDDPIHLFLEEAHEYLPQQVRGEDAHLVNAWQRIVKQGRFKGLGCTLVTQRSAALNKDVLTQVDTLIVLRTTSPQDRAAVKAWVDVHAESHEMLATLPSLESGEAWVWSPEFLGSLERIRFRRRATFDSGATPKVGEKRRTPATLADVDLAAIKEQMAETIEKAKADDPKVLRARIRELQAADHARLQQIAELQALLSEARAATPDPIVEHVEVPVLDPAVAKEIVDALESLVPKMAHVQGALSVLSDSRYSQFAPGVPVEKRAARRPAHERAAEAATRRRPPGGPSTPTPAPGDLQLRAGARRMVESLGRMAPLRLTKGQWGTVSGLKTTGGTWSTYLGEIRRAGLIDENAAGFTLTDAGFDFLGGRPSPMTAAELQDHYRGILRAGARAMLDALIDSYPTPLTREELGDAAGLATSGGTFSTYLGELTRNGLAERTQNGVRATEILMHGAEQ